MPELPNYWWFGAGFAAGLGIGALPLLLAWRHSLDRIQKVLDGLSADSR